jgi:hypothetical protein
LIANMEAFSMCRHPACLLLAAFSLFPFLAFAAENEESAKKDADTVALRGLPRVPTRATLLKGLGTHDADAEAEALRRWARELILAKEKKAQSELETITKKVRAEERARLAAETERQRRQEKYDETWGNFWVRSTRAGTPAPAHLKLDFLVPEIETYRLAAEVCRARAALAGDILAQLSRLAGNAQGALTDEAYMSAGAIWLGCSGLFQNLDYPEDGYLTEAKLEAARDLPRNARAALGAGRSGAEASGFRIQPYDVKGAGTLDVEARKAMTMAYVEIALRSAAEAEFYKNAADLLAALRQSAAARFSDVEIAPEEK